MDWTTQWLTRDNAFAESQALIDRILHTFGERESNPYAERSNTWAQAAYNLRREWFRVSIGMEFDPGEKETICLSEVKGIGNIANIENIVPFTHWLGSLFAALRHAAQSGQYPTELPYGPPGREKIRPVGPLIEYRIENSRVREADFAWTDLPRQKKVEAAEPAIARSSLPPIWLNIDPVQDRNFRWPFHGIYVLTGGPGTGKTSVALLRIRFLIEQQLQRDMIALLPTGIAPLEKEFFTERDMLVVVWEQHLHPYLKDSLLESRFGDVPVQYYDDWLNERLRSYVPIGVYRIEEGQPALETVKRKFTETQLSEWIDSWGKSGKESVHPVAASAYEKILAFIENVRKRHKLVAGPERAVENWEVLPTPLDRTRFRYTQGGVDTAIQRVKGEIDTLAKRCAAPEPVKRTGPASTRPVESASERLRRREELQAGIPALQRELDQLRSELQAAVPNRYPDLLLTFYEWETERWASDPGRFSEKARNDFVKSTKEKLQGKRRLSKTDRVLILWLIQLVAERERRDGQEPDTSLPDYSHVMIDEAQQYDPLVLRLFCRLARPPFSSVTLVGDLRQRLRENGGIVAWDDLGLQIPAERRAHLLVNYRWAEATFQALHRLADVLEMPDVELKEPLQWPAGPGLAAVYQVAENVEDELEGVIDRINTLRSRPGTGRWSIAVLLPDDYAVHRDTIVRLLSGVAIDARWTVGPDVRAGKEGVTLTNAESVVGLEFDAVFIAGAQQFLLKAPSQVQRQKFWVMATRARQHLCVTASGRVNLLTQWISEQ